MKCTPETKESISGAAEKLIKLQNRWKQSRCGQSGQAVFVSAWWDEEAAGSEQIQDWPANSLAGFLLSHPAAPELSSSVLLLPGQPLKLHHQRLDLGGQVLLDLGGLSRKWHLGWRGVILRADGGERGQRGGIGSRLIRIMFISLNLQQQPELTACSSQNPAKMIPGFCCLLTFSALLNCFTFRLILYDRPKQSVAELPSGQKIKRCIQQLYRIISGNCGMHKIKTKEKKTLIHTVQFNNWI